MTDRPIIFSGPMVRALLDGRKTQTRRLATSPLRRCAPGDRLYVREAWRTEANKDHKRPSTLFVGTPVGFLIDDEWLWPERRLIHNHPEHPGAQPGKGRPSIHMPRWASRLTLIAEAVRIEPLQDIKEADCIAEGPRLRGYADFGDLSSLNGPMVYTDQEHTYATPRCWYRELWTSLHTDEGQRWDDNPDVLVLTFRVERGNIDRIAA